MSELDKTRHTPRLFVESSLGAGVAAAVSDDQAHYLLHVLRVKAGDELRLFNGRDGEWVARVATVSKRSIEIVADRSLRPQRAVADLWLYAAPIRKAHFDFMIEKATELGVAVIQPILTERTQIRDVNTERCRAMAIEAAEQSERLDIPEIRKPVALKDITVDWPKDRVPVVCAEWGDAVPVGEAFASTRIQAAAGKAGIITGPEGGFAAVELDALRGIPGNVFIRLGPRILRADTAAIAALSLWQALRGDWR